MKIYQALLALVLFTGCSKNENLPDFSGSKRTLSDAGTATVPQRTYLALGDSYTIGESVTQQESFPFLLVAKLNRNNKNFASPVIIAKTGWTTGNLQTAVIAAKITKTYDFVSLLIGVNNQYQGLSKATYRTQFRELLNQAIKFANGKVTHVSVISIPDWGQTPYGRKSGRDIKKITADIAAFNVINREETLARGASYTDITAISRKVTTDPALVAKDGLHYSGKMHTLWVDAIIATFNRDN